MDIFITLFVGTVVGAISSFFGIGGALLWLPALYFIYPKAPVSIISASVFGFIFLNAIKNVYLFHRKNVSFPFSFLLPMAIIMGLNVILGKFLLAHLNQDDVKLVFSYFVWFLTFKELISLLKSQKVSSINSMAFQNPKFPIYLKGIFVFSLSGLISGLTSVGGGVILIPLMIFFFKIPFQNLSPYSNLCISISSSFAVFTSLFKNTPEFLGLPEFFNFFQLGELNWGVSLLLFCSSFLTSLIGIKHSQKMHPKKLKIIFAFLLLFISLKMSL